MILAAAAAAPARAQLPEIGVPRGQLRIEIGANFSVANAEFFGGERMLASEWNADIGGAFLPEIAGADTRIRTITGDANYRLSAGRSSVVASTQTGTLILSAALGITHRLTLFGTFPFVRARAQNRLTLDTTAADAGLNPADPAFGTGAGAIQTTNFFNEFDAALTTLATKIANGDYDGDLAQKALAQQTLADGTALRGEMYGLLLDPTSASPFVPVAASTAGTAIMGVVNGVQATLAGLSVGGFTTDPALPTARLSEAQYRTFLTAPTGSVGGVLRGNETLQRPGDTEIGAVYTLIDGPALRVAATGLVRLPTGLIDRSDSFFDLGTGDGQTDLEGRIAADVTRGRFGARVSAGYNRQLASTLQRRVNAPSQPIAYRARLADVTRDPGDEVTLGLEPFIRMAPGFALAFGAFRWSHAADVVSYSGTPVAGVAASELAIGSQRSATALQAGMTYSSVAGIRGKGTPIEARWAYRTIVSASGGRVDKTRTVWFQVRAFYKLW